MTESGTATVQPPLTRDETGTLVGQTFGLVAATAGLFALGGASSSRSSAEAIETMSGA